MTRECGWAGQAANREAKTWFKYRVAVDGDPRGSGDCTAIFFMAAGTDVR